MWAGLRCGRLPAALEAQSRYTQSLLDVRQSLRSALVYPLIICVLAYVLFVGSCLFVAPEYNRLFADMGSEGGTVFHVARMLRDSLPFWVAIPPLLLTALLFVGFRSNSSRTMSFRGLPRLLSWLPGVSQVVSGPTLRQLWLSCWRCWSSTKFPCTKDSAWPRGLAAIPS